MTMTMFACISQSVIHIHIHSPSIHFIIAHCHQTCCHTLGRLSDACIHMHIHIHVHSRRRNDMLAINTCHHYAMPSNLLPHIRTSLRSEFVLRTLSMQAFRYQSYICIYMYICICIYTNIHICICICIYICICICIYICIYVYVYAYIYMYTRNVSPTS
jgi:hypothetical protein